MGQKIRHSKEGLTPGAHRKTIEARITDALLEAEAQRDRELVEALRAPTLRRKKQVDLVFVGCGCAFWGMVLLLVIFWLLEKMI